MKVNVLGGYNFKRFSGTRGAEAETFLRQFIVNERNWTEQQALAQVENCLQGKALKWFQGARDSLFNNWCEFKLEFLEMFGNEKISEVCQLLDMLRTTRLKPGSAEEDLLSFFSVKQNSISFEEILISITQGLPNSIKEKLIKTKSWKDALKEASIIDKEASERKVYVDEGKKKQLQLQENKGKEVKCFR